MAYYVIYVPRPLPHALQVCMRVCMRRAREGHGVAKGLRNGYLGSPSLRTLLAANGGKGTANVLIKVKLGILSGNPQSPIPDSPSPSPCHSQSQPTTTVAATVNSQLATGSWQRALALARCYAYAA